MKDIQALYKIYSDKEAMKYRGSLPMKSIEDAIKYVRNQKIREKENLTIRRGVELIDTKELIGSIMYRYNDDRSKECEIGYSIGRQYWGQGFGKEIVKTIVNGLEDDNKINDIVAWSNKENVASIKILTKFGFKKIYQKENPNNYLFLKTKSDKSKFEKE